MRRLVPSLLLLACVWLSIAPAAAQNLNDPMARPCRNEQVAVDIDWFAGPLPPTATGTLFTPFAGRLRTHVQRALAGRVAQFFCPDGVCAPESGITEGNVLVKVRRPLANRAARPGGHRDGHERFHRVSFYLRDTPWQQMLPVEPSRQAQLLALVRAAAVRAVGPVVSEADAAMVPLWLYLNPNNGLFFGQPSAPDAGDPAAPRGRIFVHRECDVSAANVEAVPSDDMLTWHYTRLQSPDGMLPAMNPANLPRGRVPVGAPIVNVALVDTAVEKTVRGRLGVSPRYRGAEPRHPHGTTMALLLRQAAPGATLRAYTALGNGGAGTIADTATAIDAAIYDTLLLAGGAWPGTQPLVINLSLGFPPELILDARLETSGYEALEDGAGEILRFVLTEARMRDSLGAPTVVVAAAGNRIGEGLDWTTFALMDAVSWPRDACSVGSEELTSPAWFFPAGWGRMGHCLGLDPGAAPLALGVSGVDAFDQQSGVGAGLNEAALVAPGEKIFVDHPAVAARTSVEDYCLADHGGVPPTPATAVTLPAVVSGSSAATALVSGMAATIWARQLAGGGVPSRWSDLQELLYLSSMDLCRENADGNWVRRISKFGLDRLMACPAAMACVDEWDADLGLDQGMTGRGLLDMCLEALVGCGLGFSLDGQFIPQCIYPFSYREVPWPADYDVAAGSCEEVNVAVPPAPAGCPGENCPDRTGMGSTGPQPIVPLCPDCRFVGASPAALVRDLNGTVNTRLTSLTVVTSPRISVKGPRGTATITLSANTANWVAGAPIKVLGIDISAAASLTGWTPTSGTVSLVVNMREGSGPTINDASVLTLTTR